MAAKKKDLALLIGIGKPMKGEDRQEDDDGSAEDLRKKALEAFEAMVDAIEAKDYKAGLKAFCAVHGFEHALWDQDEEMHDEGSEDAEEEADEDLESAEDEG